MEFLIFALGLVVGGVITQVIFRSFFAGTLRIDNSDPFDKPYMFLELDKGMSDISSKKHIVLSVKRKDYIPHK